MNAPLWQSAHLVVVFVVFVVFEAACSSSTNTETPAAVPRTVVRIPEAVPTALVEASEADAGALPARSRSTTVVDSEDIDEVGIAECDELLRVYVTCFDDRASESERAQGKLLTRATRQSFKRVASNPAARGPLADGCKQQLENFRLLKANCHR